MPSILRLIFSLCFLLSFSLLIAQPHSDGERPAIGKIKGTILDFKTKLPVEFSAIALYKKKDSSLVTGVVADSKGFFELSQIPFGRCFMKINFIGYTQLIIDTLTIKPQHTEINFGSILIHSTAEQLGEVEVSSASSGMQLGIDRKIFNVEKNIINAGGSASDVLSGIPSVSVDIDGNISYRGSSNVTILIDGRPSSITGSSRAAILQQIPASSIESIELITNPSAKYDPDGMSGIINIILKKNKLNGFNGSVTIGVGNNDKYNTSANVSYKNSKINVFANYGFRSNNRIGSGFSHRQNIFADTNYFLNSTGYGLNKNISHNAKAGVDFYLDEKNTLGFSFLYNKGSEKSWQKSTYSEEDSAHVLSASYIRDELSDEESSGIDYNLNYRKTFAKPKQELTFDATYSTSLNDADKKYTERDYTGKYFLKGNAPYRQLVATNSTNNNTNVQIDYVQPFKKYQMKLEAGGKTVMKSMETKYTSLLYDYSVYDYALDKTTSNDFVYNENIYSAYTTFSGAIKGFGCQLGLRAEQANTTSHLITTGENFKKNYSNFFPSIHFTQKMKHEQEIQLSYSRRVNRPNSRSLNPFRENSDPYNVRYGNPYLNPEYIFAHEMNYVKYFKKGLISATVYYRKTLGIVQRIKTIGDSTISYITFQNLNSSKSYGFEIILKNDLTKWWNITSNINLFQTVIDGSNVDADLQNDNFSYTAKLLSNMRVWKNMDIQLTANYNGPSVTPQGEIKAGYAIDIGVKKEIFRNATLSLSINDITDSRKMEWEASGINFHQTMERRRESRFAMLTFSYRFGKATENTKKQRTQKSPSGGESDGGGGEM